jgi:hypothetical protein
VQHSYSVYLLSRKLQVSYSVYGVSGAIGSNKPELQVSQSCSSCSENGEYGGNSNVLLLIALTVRVIYSSIWVDAWSTRQVTLNPINL